MTDAACSGSGSHPAKTPLTWCVCVTCNLAFSPALGPHLKPSVRILSDASRTVTTLSLPRLSDRSNGHSTYSNVDAAGGEVEEVEEATMAVSGMWSRSVPGIQPVWILDPGNSTTRG